MFSLAIDGPSAAGKSTLSRKIAKRLGLLYVDTGALYRAVGLRALETSTNFLDEDCIKKMLINTKVDLKFKNSQPAVLLNGIDISGKIRTEKISKIASDISAFSVVREFLLNIQKEIPKQNNVIMEGRDISTLILPRASVKIFLTASAKQRAKRRCSELKTKNKNHAEYLKVLESIKARDHNDKNRVLSPLKLAP
ncbi:MAG: (d)CMP kinase, partial [Oscillospiraceae bacterium]|nr:(d)CMP kinase [Oscillospiraceae bacterium]